MGVKSNGASDDVPVVVPQVHAGGEIGVGEGVGEGVVGEGVGGVGGGDGDGGPRHVPTVQAIWNGPSASRSKESENV